ncbi:unnamed protein product, partial [Brenthis ino]
MVLSKESILISQDLNSSAITTAKKRRLRRKKLQAARILKSEQNNLKEKLQRVINKTEMSSKDGSEKSRDGVLAAREAKKLAKQKAKKKDVDDPNKVNANTSITTNLEQVKSKINSEKEPSKNEPETKESKSITESVKSKDEVDRAIEMAKTENVIIDTDRSKEAIKAERAAKKAAKQAKKKPNENEKPGNDKSSNDKCVNDKLALNNNDKSDNDTVINDLTVREVVNTLKDIVNVAREVQAVTDKVIAIDLHGKKQPEEEQTKSKAELKAERRAKQEAQRAAKQAAQQQKAEVKVEVKKAPTKPEEEKPKPKVEEKPKSKPQSMPKMNWFQHLYTEHDNETFKQMAVNSNLHPAVVKLGVQLASHVVTGSNARCIALLDALKKMVRDYSQPARTEFGRALEAATAAAARWLAAARAPAAAQVNALKHLRHHITMLPNGVDEFDAKKRLQEEIDRYIREQIDMAGEAISLAVRKKICDGDNILTYGCSSLVERILVEAHGAGVRFRAVVVGARAGAGAGGRTLLRRLLARRVPALYADISALSTLMRDVDKVIVGCASLLVNGAVLAAAGTLAAAQAARAHNVPLLVACETHKFADTVQTDAFVYNELGDPDELIDKTDENSPLKDWRSNPNLSLLNLTYDVTPPSLVTAVVTELAVLPCTSAPVVVRYKMSEYGL